MPWFSSCQPVEVQRTDYRMPAVQAIVSSGAPMLGVTLANLLARGFSWGDLGAIVVIWAVFFSVLLYLFSRRDRFGRDR